MRGAAFIMIFGGHALHLFTVMFPAIAILSHVLRNGIEVYFSLSGFLIGNIIFRLFNETEHSSSNLLHFYKRRWIRTLPLYYLGIIINLIAGVFITGNYHDFSWKFLFFLQSFSETGFWFYPVSYSLCIEEWFYLLFPLLLIPSCYLFKNKVKAVIILSLMYILAATCIRYHIFKNGDPHWDADMRKTLLCRIDASIYGIMMAALFNGYHHLFLKYRLQLLIIGVLMFLTAVFIHMRMYNSIINYVWYFNLVPLAFALCIPWFYSFSFRAAWLNRLFTWLSFISFAFYIIHLSPVMEVIVLFVPTNTWTSVITAFSLFTCVSLVLAHLLHVYFEKPMMNLVKR